MPPVPTYIFPRLVLASIPTQVTIRTTDRLTRALHLCSQGQSHYQDFNVTKGDTTSFATFLQRVRICIVTWVRSSLTSPFSTTPPSSTALVESREAHRVLFIIEILTQVLRNAGKPDLAAAARVCRTWMEVALNMLWEELESPHPLMSLLGPIIKHVDGWVRCTASRSGSVLNDVGLVRTGNVGFRLATRLDLRHTRKEYDRSRTVRKGSVMG